jgi:Secretion system C-terminal sorting domain
MFLCLIFRNHARCRLSPLLSRCLFIGVASLLFGLAAIPAGAQGSESFSNFPNSTVYASGTFTGNNNQTWAYTFAKVTAAAYSIAGTSVELRNLRSTGNGGDMKTTVTGGVNSVTFKYRYAQFAGGANLDVFVGGTKRASVRPLALGQVYTQTIDSLGLSGQVEIRLFSTGNPSIVIDDISWTPYSSGGGGGTGNAQRPDVAMNLGFLNDWSEEILFADALRQARFFRKPDNPLPGDNPVALDANGFPLEDAEILITHNSIRRNGTYTLTFSGPNSVQNVVVESSGFSANVGSDTYNAATNTRTLKIVVPPDYNRGAAWIIKFTGTNGGINNAKLMRPISEGSAESYSPSTVFTTQIKNGLSNVRIVRWMTPSATNEYDRFETLTWANRKPKNWRKQSRDVRKAQPASATSTIDKSSLAWEYIIDFSNETGTDPWICVPHAANDNYVQQLALFKNNLASGRKLYVEYSNEVWNFNFPQFSYAFEQARLDSAANGSTVYDNPDRRQWQRYIARRGAEISLIFRQVFGDAAMMTRVRPIFGWQRKNNNDTGTRGLTFIDDYFGKVRPGNPVARPVNYFFWGGGAAGYYNFSPGTNTNINNLWTRGAFDALKWMNQNEISEDYPRLNYQQGNSVLCSAHGLKWVMYESGPSFGDDTAGSSGVSPLGEPALADPRMKDEITEHQTVFENYGGEIFGYFVLTSDVRWGFTTSLHQLNTFKLQGLSAVDAAQKAPLTFGAAASPTQAAVIEGRSWRVTNKGINTAKTGLINAAPVAGTFAIPNGYWYSYPFRATQNGTYRVKIRYTATAAATAAIYLGPIKIGDLSLSASSTTAESASLNLTGLQPGILYSIRVEAGTGTFVLANVEIAYGPTTAVSPSPNQLRFNPLDEAVIFPNPTGHGSFTVRLPVVDGRGGSIRLMDMKGQLVTTQTIKPYTEQAEVHYGPIIPGIYRVEINANGEKTVKKVVVGF